MAPILAQVHGDAVTPGLRHDLRGAGRIGMLAAACVADGGDMVDIDAEAQAGRGEDVHALILDRTEDRAFKPFTAGRGCRA